jgi:hypothetical protein
MYVSDDVGHDTVDILVGVPMRPRKAESPFNPGAEASPKRPHFVFPHAARVTSRSDRPGSRPAPAASWAARLTMARGDVGDVLDLDQAVLAQGAAAIDQSTMRWLSPARRKFHGAGELRTQLHATRGEVRGRGARGLRGDPREIARLVLADGAGHHHAALADAEIERLVQIALALAEDVAAAHAEVRRAVLDVRGHVVGLEQEEAHLVIGDPNERAIVGEEHVRRDPRARQEGGEGLQDAPLGDRQDQFLVRFARHDRCSSNANARVPA